MAIYRVDLVAFVEAVDEDDVNELIDDAQGAGLMFDSVDIERYSE